MSSTMDSDTSKESLNMVILEDNEQLKKLAYILYKNEEALMAKITSEPERAKYLIQCRDAYHNQISLLDEANEMHEKHKKEGDETKTTVAKDILQYTKYGLNMSMQNIRNLSMRVGCVSKLQAHYATLVQELKNLDTRNLINVRRLAKDVTDSKVFMWEYTTKCQSWVGRKASQNFSRVLKQEGAKFPELVRRTMKELGFEGKFESLEDTQKLKVYNRIIEKSGRAKLPKTDVALAAAGVAVLLLTAGLMVWDIFTAEHEVETALSHSLSALQTVGQFAVQIMVDAAVTQVMVNLGYGSVTVAVAGFVAATIAGLIFVGVSGLLIDLIIGSGGNTAPNLDGLKFHTAKMPNAMSFALQIAHNS